MRDTDQKTSRVIFFLLNFSTVILKQTHFVCLPGFQPAVLSLKSHPLISTPTFQTISTEVALVISISFEGSTYLLQTKISLQILNRFSWNLVQMCMSLKGWHSITLMIPWWYLNIYWMDVLQTFIFFSGWTEITFHFVTSSQNLNLSNTIFLWPNTPIKLIPSQSHQSSLHCFQYKLANVRILMLNLIKIVPNISIVTRSM